MRIQSEKIEIEYGNENLKLILEEILKEKLRKIFK